MGNIVNLEKFRWLEGKTLAKRVHPGAKGQTMRKKGFALKVKGWELRELSTKEKQRKGIFFL